ncbi:MAG: hypothetical protein V3T64_12165, partial [Myxococcota bacterium]
TLGEHYRTSRERYRLPTTRAYDADLVRFFETERQSSSRGESAAAFVSRHRVQIRRMVARATGRHELVLDAVLGEMIERSRELRLRAVGPRQRLAIDFAILLAARSAEFGSRRRDWHAL